MTRFRILGGRYFRSVAILLLIFVLTTIESGAQSPETRPSFVLVGEGQVLEMKLAKRLDSRKANVGDDVALHLKKPLLAEGVTVLPAGWPVHGRITEVKRAGKNCAYGAIHWTFEPVPTPGGGKIEILFVRDDVARARLDHLARETAGPGAEGKTAEGNRPKTGSSAASVAKGIVLIPFAIVALPLAMIGEGVPESCPGGKGREETIRAGTTFYAETVGEVQRVGVAFDR